MTDGENLQKDDVIEEVDAEVKRVSEIFRFILKYKRQYQPSGIEFSDLRQYLPSDDANRIDWKSSARTNDLYVKEYDEEEDTDTFIILDTSTTMTFGTADKLKSEYAAVMASTISYASVDIGIRVGIGMFGEEEEFLTPERGESQYQNILRNVTDPKNYGGMFELEYAIDEVIGRLKPNTTVFIISDFIEPGEGWADKLKLANSKFEHVMCVMTRDLRDYKLPESGNVRFESPSTGSQIVVNSDSVRDKFEEEVKKQEKEIEQKILNAGASFLKIDTRDSFAARFTSYFDSEAKQW